MIANRPVLWLFLLTPATLFLVGCSKAENEYVAPPPPEVTFARPVEQLVTPFLEKNGETEAVAEAEVRARVNGFIQEINFIPGQEVKFDDVLYKIEPDFYEAAVSSATAAVAAAEAAIGVAKALVKTAEADVTETSLSLKREEELLKRGAGSKADLDAAQAASDAATANFESAEANVKTAEAEKGRAEASLAKAQLDLNYTTVHAPIEGRISKTDIKRGNLVGEGSELATIVDLSKIFANFSISDREVLQYMESDRRVMEKGEALQEIDWRSIPVYLRRESDEGFPFEGKLEYVDSEGIDARTGTLGLRAQFDNPGTQLLQGMFVTVRVPAGGPQSRLLIPEYAVGRDQRGLYVLTINNEQKVERTEIKYSKVVSGWAIVSEGLTKDSRVVIDGMQRARPGLEVTPMEEQLTVDQQTLLRGISATALPSEPESDGASQDPAQPTSTEAANSTGQPEDAEQQSEAATADESGRE